MTTPEFPRIIREVGFDFPFDFEKDPKKIWALDIPVTNIPIDSLLWHLEMPFWSSDQGYYDLSPNDLLIHPELSPVHFQKVLTADLRYPLDFVSYKGRDKIIDGLHRLTRYKMQGSLEIPARNIPLDLLLDAINR
ncbi:MAG: hypothetical protein UU09_C0014G0013 [Microgenomates group bacterium GW2011_GWA2_40_6]|nr:MAG: hypothetical protein UU09_C0014G0013 [Microgenomates group bacterium GW2011_GWA2_40_6]